MQSAMLDTMATLLMQVLCFADQCQSSVSFCIMDLGYPLTGRAKLQLTPAISSLTELQTAGKLQLEFVYLLLCVTQCL